MTRRQLFLFGALWLVWIWAIALLSRDRLPWPGNPWGYDLKRRMAPLARWDSGWYVPIAEQGYQKPPTKVGEQTNHAFFPLYPGLIRAVVRTTGIETSIAGCAISAACLLLALPLLAAYVEREFGKDLVAPAVAVFLLFPTSFFFASVYTESLVLLLSLAAAVSVQRDRPALAALSGFLAGLTRVSGLVLAPFLFLSELKKSHDRGGIGVRDVARATLVGAAPAAGFGVFCLYFYRKFGDPFLFFTAQHNWATYKKKAWQGPFLIMRDVANDVLNGATWKHPARTYEGLYLLIFAVLVWILVKQKRHVAALYCASLIGLVLLSGTFESAGRYVLPAFPAFAVLASLSRFKVAFPLWLAASAVAQAVYVFLFVNWIWAG